MNGQIKNILHGTMKKYLKVELNNMANGKEGHRQRLREKFLTSGFAGFLDYEIVELLLTLSTPRKDCKQQAKEAIKKFSSSDNLMGEYLHFFY